MGSIKVDIMELQEILDEMSEDGYVTAQLTLQHDTYTNELKLDAFSLEDSGFIDYGTIGEVSEELIY